MKRITPASHYDTDEGYPSVVDVDLHRRGFLGAAAAGAATLGGALLLPGVAEAGRRHGRRTAVLYLHYRLRGCKHRVEKVVVRSYDKRLVGFLRSVKERSGLLKALRRVLAKHRCADLHSTKRLARLQRALGRALAARYKSRTGRKTAAPVVSVVAVRHRRKPVLLGDVALPTPPQLPIA